MAEKCRATSWRTAFCHPPEKRFLRGAAHSGVFAVRRLAFFAAFWSAVNRGLRPRKLMYFLTAKSTKNSPADAFAYFVPANVRNGRLFAGLQANRPRFLPLLAGPSFHGSGIGPESFAAFRGGKLAQQQDRKRSILPSPLKAVLNRRIIACSGTRTTDSPRARSGRLHSLVLAAPAQRGPEVVPAKSDMRMVLVLLPSKVQRKPRRCRGCFVPFFRKKVPKNSPADACAYFVPANVRNGRLFAGLQANRPRFLPLLAGPSFHGSGIGPGSFAAFRGGKDASGTSRKHRSLRSPPRGGVGRTKRQQKTRRLPGCKQPAPLKRTLPRAGANEKTKRTRRRRTAKIFATKRQRYPAGEDRGMFHVLSVTKAQTKRPAKRRPFFRRMPDKSL